MAEIGLVTWSEIRGAMCQEGGMVESFLYSKGENAKFHRILGVIFDPQYGRAAPPAPPPMGITDSNWYP